MPWADLLELDRRRSPRGRRLPAPSASRSNTRRRAGARQRDHDSRARSNRTTAEKTTERQGRTPIATPPRSAWVSAGQSGARVVSDPDWWVAAVCPLLVGSQHEHRIPPSDRLAAAAIGPRLGHRDAAAASLSPGCVAVLVWRRDGAFLLRRRALVRFARLRRRLLEDAERPGRRSSPLFTVVTFVVLYGSFLALKPERLGELAGGRILINGQPLKLPVEPVLRLIALAAALRRRAGHRRGHDGRLADAGACTGTARPRSSRRARRSSIRSSAGRSPSTSSRCRRGNWSAAGC